jgi:hypothetical protein
MTKPMVLLRSTGGTLTILGLICVLAGPSISTIAADSNPPLEIAGVVILLAGYIVIAFGIVKIVVAARSGPKKT